MNSQQFASTALQFLARTSLAPSERQVFGAIETILQQLANGQLLLGAPEPAKTEKEPAK